MAEPYVSDALWRVIEPLLPKHPSRPQGGHPFTDDRPCLEGIVHVLKTGCTWQSLSRGGPWPSGSTCWRRFRDWTRAGVWPAVHRKLLDVLGAAGGIDMTAAVVDSASVRAVKGGRTPGRTPRIAGKMAVSVT